MDYGDAEHAFTVTEGRHPDIRDGMQWLTYAHLPEQLQIYSAPFYSLAVQMLNRITTDSPELKIALNLIIQAKDSGVRAGIRHGTGRAGSVPRPQEVVAPPQLADDFSATCPECHSTYPIWHKPGCSRDPGRVS